MGSGTKKTRRLLSAFIVLGVAACNGAAPDDVSSGAPATAIPMGAPAATGAPIGVPIPTGIIPPSPQGDVLEVPSALPSPFAPGHPPSAAPSASPHAPLPPPPTVPKGVAL